MVPVLIDVQVAVFTPLALRPPMLKAFLAFTANKPSFASGFAATWFDTRWSSRL